MSLFRTERVFYGFFSHVYGLLEGLGLGLLGK